MGKNCIVCGVDISDLPKQRKMCKSHKCLRSRQNSHYKNTIVKKQCKQCGEDFEGSYKQVLCSRCKTIFYNETILVSEDYHCIHCNKYIKTIERYINKRGLPKHTNIKHELVCEECKSISYNNFSVRMMHNNPMHNQETRKKVSETKLRKVESGEYEHLAINMRNIQDKMRKGIIKRPEMSIENRQCISERMKANNPMYNPIVASKVSATMKLKYANGDIIKRTGIDSPLYKGNRGFSNIVRLYLSDWKKECLRQANYKCSICGIGGILHVHHLKPFRDIVNNVLEQHNIKDKYQLLTDKNRFEVFIQDVISEHDTKIGIVVCPTCHSDIDSFYKFRKNEDKQNS
ncbi:MAG: hypothetical protein ACRDD8_08200 [Bacteroidales bacterium]